MSGMNCLAIACVILEKVCALNFDIKDAESAKVCCVMLSQQVCAEH